MDIYSSTNNKFFKLIPKLLREDVRGEWWIEDSGYAVYADGDSGDTNHESYVLNLIFHNLIEYFGINDENSYINIEDYAKPVSTELGITEQQFKSLNQKQRQDLLIKYLKESFAKDFRNDKQLQEFVELALGSTKLDAREYAIKYWRWKRMKGNEIETQTLTDEDLKIISRGIDQAYGDEIESEEEPFNIEVRSTGMYYRDVPISVIDERDAGKLNFYK